MIIRSSDNRFPKAPPLAGSRGRAPAFLLAHGWSDTASIWDGLRVALGDATVLVVERGYAGAVPERPAAPPGAILVGHSAGVLDLLCDLPPDCAGLVSINGFTRFTETAGFPDGIPRRVLDRMLARLARDPAGTIASFRARCGHAGASGALRLDRLRDGLLALRDGDGRGVTVRMLALAGAEDPIVPPGLTRACFAPGSTRWQPEAGHLLPLSHPAWCAAQLRAFAA